MEVLPHSANAVDYRPIRQVLSVLRFSILIYQLPNEYLRKDGLK